MLSGKTILLISPQRWDSIRLSKHHYAMELVKRGNTVFFLPPPNREKKGSQITVSQPLEDLPGLNVIEFELPFPYWIKFHFQWLFNLLMRPLTQRILHAIGTPLDIIWDFSNTTLFADLKLFKAPLSIYHPVDQINWENSNTKSADIIFSVSQVILDTFKDRDIPKHFINHGLGGGFFQLAHNLDDSLPPYTPGSPTKVGYIGNLLIPCFDRAIFKQTVVAHPEIEFHLWGPYLPKNTSDLSDNHALKAWIDFLENQSNVILYGRKNHHEIISHIESIDAFILCYDAKKDPNQGSNSHKLMEYLSTGKAVISTHISSYQGMDILHMLDAQDNSGFPELFAQVVTNIEAYNTPALQLSRIKFALDNAYPRQIERIEKHLINLGLAETITRS